MQGTFNNSMPPQGFNGNMPPQGFNGMPPQGFNGVPPQGIPSQGYNPNAYPYNAAAAAYNYYNVNEYPCNQFTPQTAFGQSGNLGLKDKIKNFFRFGKPQPQVLLGPDGHPLPSAYVAPNEPHARRQKYVQDRAQIDDFLGQVDFNRSRHTHHNNLHGFEYRANEGPAAGNIGPAPFPQRLSTGFSNISGPGPFPQNASGQFNAGPIQSQQFNAGPMNAGPMQSQPFNGGNMQSQRMPSQGFVGQQQNFSQAGFQQGSPTRRGDFAPAPAGFNQGQGQVFQQGSPLRRGEFPPAQGGSFHQIPGGYEKTNVEVKNLPNGGFEEKKETFRREEYITKASKPSEDKTMSEKLGDKMSDAKEWVSDKISGGEPKETKESQKADGMAKPEKVGEDLLDHEDKKTQDIIEKGQRANHEPL